MWLGVTGLLSQVVILEGYLVVRVKETAITQVSMLRYQHLQGEKKEKPAISIPADSFIVCVTQKNE